MDFVAYFCKNLFEMITQEQVKNLMNRLGALRRYL